MTKVDQSWTVRPRSRVVVLGSAALLLALVSGSSRSEPGSPLLGEKKFIASDASTAVGAAPDWKESAGKWKATGGGCLGTIMDGGFRVENADGVLTFKVTGIAWGGVPEPATKDKTSVAAKTAKTKWTPDIEEKFVVRDRGFEHFIEIKKPSAEGDLGISGVIDTDLTIEETFDGKPGASEFTMSGPAIFLNKWKKRSLGIGRTFALDAEGKSLICPVSYAKTPSGYSFEAHIPAAWLAAAAFPICVDPLIGSPGSASWSNGQEDWASSAAYGADQFLVVFVTEVTPGTWDIRAQPVGSFGSITTAGFLVVSDVGGGAMPRVAYISDGGGTFGIAYLNSANQVKLKRFNTIWELLGTDSINEVSSTNFCGAVSIASNGADNFCVAWSGRLTSGTDRPEIWAELREFDGIIAKDDTQIAAASSPGWLSYPEVVWNGTLTEWCFAWTRSDSGGPLSTSHLQAWESDLTGSTTADVLVTATGYSNDYPQLAWNSNDDEYLVVWHRQNDIDPEAGHAYQARRIGAADGDLLGSEIEIDGTVVPMVGGSLPVVSFSPPADRYLVVYGDDPSATTLGGIYGRVVLADGALWEAPFEIEDEASFAEAQACITRDVLLDHMLAAWHGIGYETDPSDVRYVVLDVTPPGIPAGLDTSNTSTAIDLTWTAAEGVWQYEVRRSTTEGGPYEIVATLDPPPYGFVSPVSWTDTDVVENTTYFYILRAKDEYNNWSFFTSEVSEVIDTIAPAAPTGLAGTSGDTMVDLTWTPNTEPDLAGYNAYYRLVGAPDWTMHNTSLIATPAYSVTGLTNGLDYEFAVSAVDTEPNESPKSTSTVVRPKDGTIPSTPTGLAATPGNHVVDLSWDANSEPDLAGYNLYRSEAEAGVYEKINSTLITGLAFSDTGRTNGVTYWYKVAAEDSSTNESPHSAPVSATPMYPAPTGMTFDSNTYNSITFHWTAVADPAAEYKVFRSATSGGGYALITPTPIPETTYIDEGLSSGTYYYAVKAVAGAEESAYSAELAASTEAVPPPTLSPSTTRKTDDTSPAIAGTAGGPETAGWIVKLYEGATYLGEGIADGTGAFVISTVELAEGEHVIQATSTVPITGDPVSSLSSGVVVTVDITPPAPPTGVRILAGDGWIEVAWNDNSEADLLGYNISRRISGIGSFVRLNDKPLLKPKYLDSSVVNGTTYEYRVTAVDDTLDE